MAGGLGALRFVAISTMPVECIVGVAIAILVNDEARSAPIPQGLPKPLGRIVLTMLGEAI
jgi:hypothetical protein